MEQTMEQPLACLPDRAIIDQYLVRQNGAEVIRALDGAMESVDYLPDTSVRVWYNNQRVSYAAHWHSAFELIMPVEGDYVVESGMTTFRLKPGDILVIPSGELHRLRAPGGGGRFIFLFEVSSFAQFKGASYLTSYFYQPVLINRETCPSIFDAEMDIAVSLCREYLQEDGLKEIAIQIKLMSFFLNYGRYCLSQEDNALPQVLSENSQKSYAEKFNAVFTYIDQHFTEDLTLEQVADVAGFSKFHFSRTFKQFSGTNFYEYLRRRRIKAAELLLMRRDLSISEIALYSGFSSVSTFNRTFKNAKGCTPTEFRGLFQAHAL